MELRYQGFVFKLENFIYRLAVQPGDIRSRFRYIMFDMSVIHNDEIHPHFVSEWNIIMENMCSKGPGLNWQGVQISGALENTLLNSRNKTYSKIAEKMLDLLLDMKSY